MSVNGETLMTHDEFDRAREVAESRYLTMLNEVDYSMTPHDDQSVAARESQLALMAWRQAMAFELMARLASAGNLYG